MLIQSEISWKGSGARARRSLLCPGARLRPQPLQLSSQPLRTGHRGLTAASDLIEFSADAALRGDIGYELFGSPGHTPFMKVIVLFLQVRLRIRPRVPGAVAIELAAARSNDGQQALDLRGPAWCG